MIHHIILAACCAVSGRVHAADGHPIAGAHVALIAANHTDAASSADGRFTLEAPAGTYRLVVSAPGFAATELDGVTVHGGDTLDVTLEPLGSGRPRTIGSVIVDGRLAVAKAPVPERDITRVDLDALGAENAIEALENVPSLTATRPSGAGGGAPVVVSLRGPDPSETRITFDGQILNDTNTGDLDLAHVPTSLLSGIDVSEGLGPDDEGGANTIGGEINLRALAPTALPHTLLRLSAGSFGASSASFAATGTQDKFGYAVSFGRGGETGYVNNYAAAVAGTPLTLGSATLTSNALVNFTYAFSPRTTFRVRTMTLDSRSDLSGIANAPDPASTTGDFAGPGAEWRSQSIRATLASLSTQLGSGTLTGSFANSSTSIAIDDAAAIDPYNVSYIDRIGTATLEWARSIDGFDLYLGGYVRGESLVSGDQFTMPLSERSYAFTARTGVDVGPRLHLSGALSDTRYSTFGTSVDARLGVRYATGGDGALRFAFGTGFRAPLLAERFALPLADLVPDQNCVGTNGNPNLDPEHAVEYELGYGNRIGPGTTFDATVYRTILRDPIENLYPLGTTCGGGSTVVAQTYPINVGNVIYQGEAITLAHRFGALFAKVEYGVNSAYPTQLPAYVANPTSNANLVVGEQFANIPLQTLAFDLRYAYRGWHGGTNLTVKSTNNELNQGRFATLDGAIGKSWKNVDITLAGQNLTNAVSGQFTRIGAGVPYAGLDGSEPTNAYVLTPPSVRLILSLKN